MGRLKLAIFSNSGRNSGRSSGRPFTFEKNWTPTALRSLTARSISPRAASGLFMGMEATNPGNRSGYLATYSARPSFATSANSGVSSGPANASKGGEVRQITWA